MIQSESPKDYELDFPLAIQSDSRLVSQLDSPLVIQMGSQLVILLEILLEIQLDYLSVNPLVNRLDSQSDPQLENLLDFPSACQ